MLPTRQNAEAHTGARMKKLALMTLVLAVFCSALSFAGYVGFQLLAGKVPTPVHVRDSIATTNEARKGR